MEDICDEESKKRKHMDNIFDKIADNNQLETMKVLKTYNTTLINKYKYQSGTEIVSNHFQNYIYIILIFD